MNNDRTSIDLNILAQRIQDQIKRTPDLNQSKLARESGISKAALSQILAKLRTPNSEILLRLADALCVSMDYLTGRTEESEVAALLQHKRILALVQDFLQLSPAEQKSVENLIKGLLKAKAAAEDSSPPSNLNEK